MTECLDCGTAGRRRRRLRERAETGDRRLNALEWIEVADSQQSLTVGFVLEAPRIRLGNVRIEGSAGALPVSVTSVGVCGAGDPDIDRCVKIGVDHAGDFSTYRLCIVERGPDGRPGSTPLGGFDPRLSCLEFSFKSGCETNLDCAPDHPCPPTTYDEPEISYLAKDYASFRQLILDRLALIMPGWTERHVPDIELTLVELLAYVGDQLSYAQDAVATEAYLETARLRTSVRRHLRLIDYRLHEGSNARAWVAIESTDDITLPTGEARFITLPADGALPPAPAILESEIASIIRDVLVYEPVVARPIDVVAAHSKIRFWSWGESECCLPRGATRATLRDGWVDRPAEPGPADDAEEYEPTAHRSRKPPRPGPEERERLLRLKPGDVLIFEEVVGPRTGCEPDADAERRHAVRLTSVVPTTDVAYDQPLVEITWGVDDALPFELCINAVGGVCCDEFEPSVARGNVVLVDHGRTVCWCTECPTIEVQPAEERPGPCVDTPCRDGHERADPIAVPVRVVRPLDDGPLTFAEPYPRARDVATAQADRLEGLAARLDRRLEELWHRVREGGELSDSEATELRRLFGDVDSKGSRPGGETHSNASVLARALADKDRRLARKLGRVDGLARRARAGYRLVQDDIDELAEAFGAEYVEGLDGRDPAAFGPAAAALEQDPREAMPAVSVDEMGVTPWKPQLDLLSSRGTDRHIAVDVDDDGAASLRFGDGVLGAAPEAGSRFRVRHRVTGGATGNVGSGAIARLVTCTTRPTGITRVRNPLPARGGVDREASAEAKAYGPPSIRQPMRAVIDRDYAAFATRRRRVQRAGAALRWTGGWYEAVVGIDAAGTGEAEPALLAAIADGLEPYRRIGHDVRVRGAGSVPILLGLVVCVAPGYAQSDVRRGLLTRFGTGLGADGRPAFFHPDNLTFGTNLEVSRIIAAALDVPGIESVVVHRLERVFGGPDGEIEAGILRVGDLDVVRLDNDARFPERGRLELDLRGGT